MTFSNGVTCSRCQGSIKVRPEGGVYCDGCSTYRPTDSTVHKQQNK